MLNPPAECTWIRVGAYLVAPVMIAPVGIGEAARIAREHGCELPTPDLVDAIWLAADLKLEPIPMSPNRGDDRAQAEAHAAKVRDALGDRSFRLVAGTHKDVVERGGKVGLYGWHVERPVTFEARTKIPTHAPATRLDGARVVQPFFAGHAPAWKDYSQGLRLCRRVA